MFKYIQNLLIMSIILIIIATIILLYIAINTSVIYNINELSGLWMVWHKLIGPNKCQTSTE